MLLEACTIWYIAGALALLGVVGAAAAGGKAASDVTHECDDVTGIIPKLQCIIEKYPKLAFETVKATVSSGITSIASWAAGTQEWFKIKFAIDAYSGYDSADSIRKAIGIRRCDQPAESSHNIGSNLSTLESVDPSDLNPDDIYHRLLSLPHLLIGSRISNAKCKKCYHEKCGSCPYG